MSECQACTACWLNINLVSYQMLADGKSHLNQLHVKGCTLRIHLFGNIVDLEEMRCGSGKMSYNALHRHTLTSDPVILDLSLVPAQLPIYSLQILLIKVKRYSLIPSRKNCSHSWKAVWGPARVSSLTEYLRGPPVDMLASTQHLLLIVWIIKHRTQRNVIILFRDNLHWGGRMI